MQNDPRKQSIYLETWVIQELRAQAKRQSRSVSWIMQRAWRLAKAEIESAPVSPKHQALHGSRDVLPKPKPMPVTPVASMGDAWREHLSKRQP